MISDKAYERCLSQLSKRERKRLAEGERRADGDGWADMIRGPQDIYALAEGCYVDPRFADHAQNFFELGLIHATGRWAGKPFILQDWQREDIVRPLFGWRRIDLSRRYRSAWVKVPKKNGKTTVCGGLIDYLLVAEPDPDQPSRTEQAQEIYAASTNQEVASILFREAKKLANASPTMRRLGVEVKDQSRRIIFPKTQSFFRVLPHKSESSEGMIAGGVVLDEVHAMKSRALFDALRWSGSSRRQMLMFLITTAGIDDKEALWMVQDLYAKRVRDGEHRDTSLLVAIYEADADAEVDDIEQLRKANPSLGVTINEDELLQEARQVKGEGPAAIAAFKRYRMNIAVGAEKGWLSPEQWDKGQQPFDVAELVDRPCLAGVDLAKVSDFTALVLLWPPILNDEYARSVWHGTLRLWLPKAAIDERTRMGDMSYQSWAEAGLIEVTDGDTTDHQLVRAGIKEEAERYNIRKIGIDRLFDGWQFTQDLFNDDELPAVGVGQGWKSQDMPMRRTEVLVREGRLNFGGHPIMRWMIGNAIAKRNGTNECLSLDRAKATDKIDGVAAYLNAMFLAEATPDDEGPPTEYKDCPLVIL